MEKASVWSAMLFLSAVVHAGLAALFLASFAPRPVAHKTTPPAEMALSTLNVPRTTASQAPPKQDASPSEDVQSEGLGTQPIPQNTAIPKEPVDTISPLLEPDPAKLTDSASPQSASEITRPVGQSIDAATLDHTPVVSDRIEATRVPKLQPQTTTASQQEESAPKAPALVPTLASATTLRAAGPTLVEARPPASNATRIDQRLLANFAQTLDTPDTSLDAQRADAQRLPEGTARSSAAHQAALVTARAQTVLAWSGTLSLEVPQSTLDTAAALRLPPSGSGAQGLRNALATHLNDVNCARAQTVYDPETGAIDLRGHVKNETDRNTLLNAVSNQLGGSLPVQDKLQQLGAPQCNVLVQLAEMPLPQSVEQLTNPLIIGADLQTRSYSFSDGQLMKFDLAGADYDGWLYLDYYDNQGQVLHLLPNAHIPPLFLPANAPLVFGGGSADDPARGRFEMRVSPPFGQDIIVAMISNEPLFDSLRPTVEKAEPFLSDLAARVEKLRNENPDFKGEWVYLFVETLPER